MYYKVVRNVDGELVSACANEYLVKPKYQVTYKPNEWAEPILENSLLFCFESLEKAQEFVDREMSGFGHNIEIWECEVDGDKRHFDVLACSYGLLEFWKLAESLFAQAQNITVNMFEKLDMPFTNHFTRNAPKQTLGVSRIKLINQVTQIEG